MTKKILALDYGAQHVGLALAESWLTEPLPALSAASDKSKLQLLIPIIQKQGVSVIVLGLPTGTMHAKIKKFGSMLEQATQLPVVFVDERHSSVIAASQAKEAGKKLKKLGTKEHSLAACVILQTYLDEHAQD